MSKVELQASLRQELRGAEAAYLDRLSADQLAALRDAVNAARAHERQALRDGIDEALKVIPALLRRPIKKILFPKD